MKYFLNGTWVNDMTISEAPEGAVVLSDVEWETRQSEPFIPPWELTKATELVGVRATFEATINRLTGIAARFERAGDPATALGCDAAVLALIALPTSPAVVAAANDAELKLAVKTAYAQAVVLLPLAAKLQFRAMEAP